MHILLLLSTCMYARRVQHHFMVSSHTSTPESFTAEFNILSLDSVLHPVIILQICEIWRPHNRRRWRSKSCGRLRRVDW